MADKGVIIEYDFAAMDGAGLLFRTARQYLQELDGIELDERREAKYLAGGNYQGALAELFEAVKTKKTAAKAARELSEAFVRALGDGLVRSVTPGFRNFVKNLADRGVRVVIASRADIAVIAEAFAPMVSESVTVYREESQTYCSIKWDAWRRACVANGLRPSSTVAVTGSGIGVKAALLAGMPSVAVVSSHVAYQDYGGADCVVQALNADAVKKTLGVLRIG